MFMFAVLHHYQILVWLFFSLCCVSFQFDLKKAQEITPEDKGGEFAFCVTKFEIESPPSAILHNSVSEIDMQAHSLSVTAFLGIEISPSLHKNSEITYSWFRSLRVWWQLALYEGLGGTAPRIPARLLWWWTGGQMRSDRNLHRRGHLQMMLREQGGVKENLELDVAERCWDSFGCDRQEKERFHQRECTY